MFWFFRRCKSFIILLNHQWKLSRIPLPMKGTTRELYDDASNMRVPREIVKQIKQPDGSVKNIYTRGMDSMPPLPPLGPDGCMHANRKIVNVGPRFVIRCKTCNQVLRTAVAEKLEDYQARVAR